ncbi:hypothetical protein EBT16_14945, partial [bacterium]|nr:hypothetical protein [bacterium]
LEGGKSENPSFDIGFPGEKSGETHRCAATALKDPRDRQKQRSDDTTCTAVTAAHCVEPSFGKKARVSTAYGELTMEVIPHPEYAAAHEKAKKEKQEGGEKPFDVAVLKIQDQKFCKQAAKVSLCPNQPKKGDKLFMASSWMGKLMSGGLAPGLGISTHGDFIDTLIGEGVSLSGSSPDTRAAITQGDSGGGGFMRGEFNELCLLGVLSGTGKKNPAEPPLPPDFSKDASYAAGAKVTSFIKGSFP